jgi:hypothetical protein
MVEDGPNLVTPEGLAQIDAHIARIESAMQSETNILLRETLARDLRYWTVRPWRAKRVSRSNGPARGDERRELGRAARSHKAT